MLINALPHSPPSPTPSLLFLVFQLPLLLSCCMHSISLFSSSSTLNISSSLLWSPFCFQYPHTHFNMHWNLKSEHERSFWVWFSLFNRLSSCIHLPADATFYFSSHLNKAPMCRCMPLSLSIYQLLGHRRWFSFIAIVMSAAINVIYILTSNVQGLMLPTTSPTFVRGQLVGIGSLFPLWGFQGFKSSHQAWLQVLLPAEPSHSPVLVFLMTVILTGVWWNLKAVLNSISLVAKDSNSVFNFNGQWSGVISFECRLWSRQSGLVSSASSWPPIPRIQLAKPPFSPGISAGLKRAESGGHVMEDSPSRPPPRPHAPPPPKERYVLAPSLAKMPWSRYCLYCSASGFHCCGEHPRWSTVKRWKVYCGWSSLGSFHDKYWALVKTAHHWQSLWWRKPIYLKSWRKDRGKGCGPSVLFKKKLQFPFSSLLSSTSLYSQTGTSF